MHYELCAIRFLFSNLMDKTILQSSRALPNCSNYAVGIFQDGELHVTPLKGVIQMRPQFNYLDKSDKRVREEAKNMGEGSISMCIYVYRKVSALFLNLYKYFSLLMYRIR